MAKQEKRTGRVIGVNGRNGVMPGHEQLLGEERTKILAAYVYSLSQ